MINKIKDLSENCFDEILDIRRHAKIMIGESNSLIKQHMSQISHVFGSGKEKSIQFWHSIIRQVYVKQLITKEIESYGVLKITDKGIDFIKSPDKVSCTL